METLTIRFSLMATLGLFTLMLIVGAGLGIAMLSRANHGSIVAQQVADETRDINDIYADTARTRIALMRVYTDLKEEGKQPNSPNNYCSVFWWTRSTGMLLSKRRTMAWPTLTSAYTMPLRAGTAQRSGDLG